MLEVPSRICGVIHAYPIKRPVAGRFMRSIVNASPAALGRASTQRCSAPARIAIRQGASGESKPIFP